MGTDPSSEEDIQEATWHRHELALMGTFVDTLDNVSKAMLTLSGDVKRLDRSQYFFWFISIVSAVGLIATALMLPFLIKFATDNHKNGQILLECTTPSTPGHVHSCNDQSKADTSTAVKQIIVGTDCAVRADIADAVKQATNSATFTLRATASCPAYTAK